MNFNDTLQAFAKAEKLPGFPAFFKDLLAKSLGVDVATINAAGDSDNPETQKMLEDRAFYIDKLCKLETERRAGGG